MDDFTIDNSSKSINNLTEESLKLIITTIKEANSAIIAEKNSRIEGYKETIEYYRKQIEEQAITIKSLSEKLQTMNYNQQIHSGTGDNVGGDKNVTNIYSSQDVTQTAEYIQTLLEQLGKTYDSSKTAGKMTIATQAIEKIDNDNNLTQRVISALRAGGISAIEGLLDHPAASFFIAALKDWKQNNSETIYLNSIPGMVKSIQEASAEPLSEGTPLEELDW